MKWWVYRYFDARGELLYVGKSTCVGARLTHHQNEEWGPTITTVRMMEFDDPTKAAHAEAAAIYLEAPIHNSQYRKGLPPAHPECGKCNEVNVRAADRMRKLRASE